MIDQHPITPPPELIEQWMQVHTTKYDLARQAARWGADTELEACCEWLDREGWSGESRQLRAARRPKPPSLKEQALEALRHAPGPDYPNPITLLTADEHALIRRALEQLDD
jgi:hypothetical protein